jgi:hypothetical protein
VEGNIPDNIDVHFRPRGVSFRSFLLWLRGRQFLRSPLRLLTVGLLLRYFRTFPTLLPLGHLVSADSVEARL